MNSQDIFIKSNFNESTNDIIHLDLSDTNQNGGNTDNNIIHLSLSSTIDKENIYKTGGRTDSSEYFNKLAEQIVNSKTISQNGGFNVITTIDESSEIFLSSETINDIKNVSMTGGTKNKKRILFDFNDLKKHLLKVSENLDGGSDSEDNDVLNVDDSIDDDDKNEEEEIKKLFNDESDNSESLSEFMKEKKTVEEKIINKNDKKNVISLESHRSTAKQNKAKRSSNDDTDSDMESKSDSDSDSESEDLELDLEDDDDSDNDDKKNKEHKKKETKADISDSVSLGGSSTEYQFSDSISSPKLVSYRKIENTLIGRRHL